MPDISMCRNASCHNRNTCFRYLARPNHNRQSYADFSPLMMSGECSFYWPTLYLIDSNIRTVEEADEFNTPIDVVPEGNIDNTTESAARVADGDTGELGD